VTFSVLVKFWIYSVSSISSNSPLYCVLDCKRMIFQWPHIVCLPPCCCAGSVVGQRNSGVSAEKQGLLETQATCQKTVGGPVFSQAGTLTVSTIQMIFIHKNSLRKWPAYVFVHFLRLKEWQPLTHVIEADAKAQMTQQWNLLVKDHYGPPNRQFT